jgi:iron complex transport system substrate-binding protein
MKSLRYAVVGTVPTAVGSRWRAIAALCGIVIWVCGSAIAAEIHIGPFKKPSVVSINLCTDQLAVLLADPEQILALSTLSREIPGSYFHEQAQRFPQIAPLAEDILQYTPDVILAGPYLSRYTLALLEELNLRVETIPIANSIADMLRNLESVGKVLQQQEKSTSLREDIHARLTRIKERVAALARTTKGQPRAAVYDANGYTVGEKTMRGEAMKLAGWHNVVLERGVDTYGVLALEELINLAPDALIASPYGTGHYSRAQQLASHPSLHASGLNPLVIPLPSNQTVCAGPWSVDIIETLLEAREGLR